MGSWATLLVLRQHLSAQCPAAGLGLQQGAALSPRQAPGVTLGDGMVRQEQFVLQALGFYWEVEEPALCLGNRRRSKGDSAVPCKAPHSCGE